ncbi:hypothetical protein Bhyg_04096, partial [Pseudolycoriella hygida]
MTKLLRGSSGEEIEWKLRPSQEFQTRSLFWYLEIDDDSPLTPYQIPILLHSSGTIVLVAERRYTKIADSNVRNE